MFPTVFPAVAYFLLGSLWLIAWAKLFDRIGWSSLWAIAMIVPGVNAAVFLWFAFSEWPLERRAQLVERVAAR